METPEKVYRLCVGPDEAGMRLDRFLAAGISDLTRSRLQALVTGGHVACGDGTVQDSGAKVKPGQDYRVRVPAVIAAHHASQAMALDILFEDDSLLVVNKPAGLTVHPAPGHADGTLVNALLAHCGESLSGVGGVARPGIVHRIDKDTSGLMVVAKKDSAHLSLSRQLADRTLRRIYSALAWGAPAQLRGRIEGNIGRSPSNRQKMAVVKTGGKPALTHYEVLEIYQPGTARPLACLFECRLETGRTHQIRVHLAKIGHPLVGDPVYGQSTQSRLNALGKALPAETVQALQAFKRQALHARELSFIHPVSGQALSFACPLPDDMTRLLHSLL